MGKQTMASRGPAAAILTLLLHIPLWAAEDAPLPPYQANGVKIGEVTQTSAIVWTRLTREPERKTDGVPFPDVEWTSSKNDEGSYQYDAPQIPEGKTLDEMQDIVPGMSGEVRIKHWPEGAEKDGRSETPWEAVDAERDFTRQFHLTGLEPGTTYEFRAQCRESASGTQGQTIKGSFKTAPAPDKPARVVFTVVTGQGFWRRDNEEMGHSIYPRMTELAPDFFAHTGDILYYDKRRPVAQSIEQARMKWNRVYALPFQRDFHTQVSSYFIKDDHDTWQNDCWPAMKNNRMGDFTFEQGQAVFLEQVPMGQRTYRTVRWGKDLQIWLVEGRDFRSSNKMPDGPDKTIWGEEQKAWFKRTVLESDAAFRILISPTPIVGPDRESKNDNHSNKGFTHEGDELRQFISEQKNMAIICGDRHWQYVSVDPKTGAREYSCGPTSDAHAGGFKQDLREPMHQYLNICGGFLSGTVERIEGEPALTFRHHGVDGAVLNEDRLP
jgi:alkaline phosphatase D